jgi:hypothetical protein
MKELPFTLLLLVIRSQTPSLFTVLGGHPSNSLKQALISDA